MDKSIATIPLHMRLCVWRCVCEAGRAGVGCSAKNRTGSVVPKYARHTVCKEMHLIFHRLSRRGSFCLPATACVILVLAASGTTVADRAAAQSYPKQSETYMIVCVKCE